MIRGNKVVGMLLGGLALVGCCHAQHIHIAAGAESGVVGSKLLFSNGFLYDINSYGGINPACIYMEDDDPLYPSLYQTSASFISLPSSPWTGGPTSFAAEPGSHIEMVIRSVQGPCRWRDRLLAGERRRDGDAEAVCGTQRGDEWDEPVQPE